MMRPVSAQPFYSPSYTQNYQMEQSMSRLYRDIPQQPSKKLSKRPAAGRLMPHLMLHDKQQLYSQSINLKQHLHELRDENTKLKTRLAFLDKQNLRLNNYIVSGDSSSSCGILPSKPYQKDINSSSMIINLKKLLKEAREQIDTLQSDNVALKKTVKYTKISELEIERKALADQAGRLKAIVDELMQHQDEQIDWRNQIQALTDQLRTQNQENQNLLQANAQQEQTIQYLEGKLRDTEKSLQTRESKIIKDLKVAKLKIQDNLRKQEIYQNYIATLEQKNSESAQTVARLSTAVARASTISKPSFRRNFKLSQQPDVKQLDEINHLRMSESHKSNFKPARIPSAKPRSPSSNSALANKKPATTDSTSQALHKPIIPTIRLGSQDSDKPTTTNKSQAQLPLPLALPQKSANHDSVEQSQKSSSTHQFISKVPSQREYPEDFENKNQIEKYNDDFQDSNKEEILFQKEVEKGSKKGGNQRGQGGNQEVLKEVEEIIVLRLKAQRYPIEQLKGDIKMSCPTIIQIGQLADLLQKQPFYLCETYAKTFLQYLFNTTKLQSDMQISIIDFISKLETLIKPFPLKPQQEQQQLASQVYQLLLKTWPTLQKKLHPLKNPDNSTIPFPALATALRQLGFQLAHIQLMITDLSLSCVDLEHLDYMALCDVYFQDRQDIDYESHREDFTRQQTKTIKEEYEESSMSNGGQRRPLGDAADIGDEDGKAHSFSMGGGADEQDEQVLSAGLV